MTPATPTREKRPPRDWRLLRWSAPDGQRLAESYWIRGSILVISSLVMADLPDGSGIGPQWHVSISHRGKRPQPREVERALRAFGMVGAEEDNHHPGVARHFWRPCDPAHRVDCECKVDEQTVVDADGYRWTNPHDAADCRGCEFEKVVGKPCPVHAQRIAERGAST